MRMGYDSRPGVGDTPLGGRRGNCQCMGDVGDLQALEESKRERRAFLGAQSIQDAIEADKRFA